MVKRKMLKGLTEIIVIIAIFVLFSYLVQSNIKFLERIIGHGFMSVLLYVFVTVIAVVIAPISAAPLLPLASNIWGWFLAGIFSIIGWSIGALIAFMIARKYGTSIIRKFIKLENLHKVEKRIPKERVFLSVVFLRMIIPVDVLSYALGLFSKIKTRDYVLATVIGITPFAFILAYLGTIPFVYQLLAFLVALIILLTWLVISKMVKKTNIGNIKKLYKG